jgi:hypothetical protein
MLKKIATIGFIGLFALPSSGLAASNTELTEQINQLTLQNKTIMKKLSELQSQLQGQDEVFEEIEEQAEGWDLASRFQLSGDIRNRLDYVSADVPDYWNAREVSKMMGATHYGMVTPDTSPEQMNAMFNTFKANSEGLATAMGITPVQARNLMLQNPGALGYTFSGATPIDSHSVDNDTHFSTRLRMNLRVKATENIEMKARVVGYKTWGMQSSQFGAEDDPNAVYDPFFLNNRSFDGTVGRQATGSELVLDRAFMNWNNIGGQPVWFSIGRRPTTDGPPAHLRMGNNKRMATPINYMDYPFDGVSMGYAYANLFGIDDMPGRVRFCYGRGYENGPESSDATSSMNDVDFGGISWDILKKGARFINIQTFGAFNIFNVPGDTNYANPIEVEASLDPADPYFGSTDIYLDRKNMGNIYHTSMIYMDKIESANLNYFITGGWSRTDPNGMDELGASLLGSWGKEADPENGFGFYGGIRYDMDDLGLKFGVEYNYGSKNWLAFTPGHDDVYSSKLYTRGSVYELYTIWDLPSGEAISKFGKAFMRLGYQHYDYDYTYSGMWLGEPTKIGSDLDDPLTAQFYAPIESMDQVYLTIEAYF